eukprot:tig00000857_g4931.t1
MWAWSPERLPCPTKAIDFDKLFHCEDRVARNHLQNATDARAHAAKMLDSKRTDPATVLNACERYAPYVASCVATVVGNPQTRFRDGPPKVAWTSGVHQKSGGFSVQDIKLELCMLLSAMGYLRMRQASAAVSSVPPSHPSFEDALKQAGQFLRQAAGLFDAAGGMGFLNLPFERPPEMVPAVCAGLSRLAIAELQRLAAAKGAAAGSSKSMLARLSAGAKGLYEAAGAALRAAGTDYAELSAGLRKYVDEMALLCHAMGLFYLAEDAYAKSEFGRAVGYVQAAAKAVQRLSPSQSMPEGGARGAVQAFCSAVVQTCERYTKENQGIYFAVIPSDAELQPPAPLELQNLRAIPFEPPPALFTGL